MLATMSSRELAEWKELYAIEAAEKAQEQGQGGQQQPAAGMTRGLM